nr:uncharacterized protein LOC131783465 [Pocillopora verrucosa]
MAAPIKWMMLFMVVVIGAAEAAPKFNVSPRETKNYVQDESLFEKLDSNNDGFVSESELNKFKIQWNEVKVYDLNNDKKLSEEELDILEAVSKNIKETNYLNHFRAADQNHDGYVTAAELKSRFQALGSSYTLQQMTNFINSKDQDGDQRFNYKEFKKALFNAV